MIKTLGIYAPFVICMMLALSSGLGLLEYRHDHVFGLLVRIFIFLISIIWGIFTFLRIRKEQQLSLGPSA